MTQIRRIFFKLYHLNPKILFVFLYVMVCTSCAGKASVRLWENNIDFSKYDKIYYTVCNPSADNLKERISVANDLSYYLFRPLNFKPSQEEGILTEKPDDYLSYLESIKNKENTLFIRTNFEYGLSIPPRLKRDLDGFIWKHRAETTIWIIDLKTEESLAILKYKRRYFDGKIPEEVMYELLIKALREGKSYIEQ